METKHLWPGTNFPYKTTLDSSHQSVHFIAVWQCIGSNSSYIVKSMPSWIEAICCGLGRDSLQILEPIQNKYKNGSMRLPCTRELGEPASHFIFCSVNLQRSKAPMECFLVDFTFALVDKDFYYTFCLTPVYSHCSNILYPLSEDP